MNVVRNRKSFQAMSYGIIKLWLWSILFYGRTCLGQKRIGLSPASLPWAFGAYQSQMYALSLYLKREGYELVWIPRTRNASPPEGLYRSWKEMKPHLPRIVDPPEGFELGHLQFLGRQEGKSSKWTASELNDLANRYDIDAFITLMDTTELFPNMPLKVPVVGWSPLHAIRVTPSQHDYWALKNFHVVASLCPSSAQTIQEALPDLHTALVPHIIDREQLTATANEGLQYFHKFSPREADKFLLTHTNPRAAAAGTPLPFLSPSDKSTFLILMQNGNYEANDRKGWDTAIQAYALFYQNYLQLLNSATDAQNDYHLYPPYLYIHSIPSYRVEADMNNRQEAPPQVLPIGLNIQKHLHISQVPKNSYTLDQSIHEPQIVHALKAKASICLHPSKIEGFGMNALECQALSTPVITTNTTAMADYTKLGRAVAYRQTISPARYERYPLAMPDVHGIAAALMELYLTHVAIQKEAQLEIEEQHVTNQRKQDIAQVQHWIDDQFSLEKIGQSFVSLLSVAASEHEKCSSKKFPKTPTFQEYVCVAHGEYPDVVDCKKPWTLITPHDQFTLLKEEKLVLMLMVYEHNANVMFILPSVYEQNGQNVPTQTANQMLHPHASIIIKTYLMPSLQDSATRRSSISWLALQHALEVDSVHGLPDGHFVTRVNDY